MGSYHAYEPILDSILRENERGSPKTPNQLYETRLHSGLRFMWRVLVVQLGSRRWRRGSQFPTRAFAVSVSINGFRMEYEEVD